MTHPSSYKPGRHFLQIPGPTNVPERILRAIDRPTSDHRGKEFAHLGCECLEGMKPIFNTTSGEVFIYPASGTGAWEAAIVNTLSAGDRVLMIETGHFAALWRNLAQKLGLVVEYVPGDWRHGIDAQLVTARLSSDRDRKIKAVMCVHNETSTGVTSDIAAVRKAMDAEKHPALLMVDTVSSLASIDYRHDGRSAISQRRPGTLQSFSRRRSWKGGRTRLPNRPPGRSERPDAVRCPLWSRNGSGAGRDSSSAGRIAAAMEFLRGVSSVVSVSVSGGRCRPLNRARYRFF
jgi:hypothetical protein